MDRRCDPPPPAGRHRLALVLGAVMLNATCTAAWWWPVLAGGGATLAQPSVADAGWLVGNLLLAVAIVIALAKRESPLLVVLDVATTAVGVGLVVGIVLVGPDLVAGMVPMKVRVTQACYVVCDVVLFSAAVRLALSPRPRPLAAWLLAATALGIVFSDAAWKLADGLGTYAPGSWGTSGGSSPRPRSARRPPSVDAAPRHARVAPGHEPARGGAGAPAPPRSSAP